MLAVGSRRRIRQAHSPLRYSSRRLIFTDTRPHLEARKYAASVVSSASCIISSRMSNARMGRRSRVDKWGFPAADSLSYWKFSVVC